LQNQNNAEEFPHYGTKTPAVSKRREQLRRKIEKRKRKERKVLSKNWNGKVERRKAEDGILPCSNSHGDEDKLTLLPDPNLTPAVVPTSIHFIRCLSRDLGIKTNKAYNGDDTLEKFI